MKIAVPCPACRQTPVDALHLLDGEIWICLGCGHHDVGAGVDLEAQIEMLNQHAPALAKSWCQALGLSDALRAVAMAHESRLRCNGALELL